MTDPREFIQKLENYQPGNEKESARKEASKYLNNEFFSYNFMLRRSEFAAWLCVWVRAIIEQRYEKVPDIDELEIILIL